MLKVEQDVLDEDAVQTQLNQVYERWRLSLCNEEAWFEGAVPPLLMKVTEEYCRAPLRILFYGQETEGWGPDPTQSLDCFIGGGLPVERLVDFYGAFDFAATSPRRKSPFWRAFREFRTMEGSSLLWNNLCKVAFASAGKYSFLKAPIERKTEFVRQQTQLLREEVRILLPHAVIFVTGPHYDHILNQVFETEGIEQVMPNATSTELGRLVSRYLPALSFRTYHPGFLRREYKSRWPWLEEVRTQIARGHAIAQSPFFSTAPSE